MTNTKRMPKPMSSKVLAQYLELHANLMVQAELTAAPAHNCDVGTPQAMEPA